MHWLLPGVPPAASAAFAVAVLRQYAARHRPYQLAWGIALSMFTAASLALTAGVVAGWHPLSFKLYYLFGAILNVPWLALGTVELLAGASVRRAYLAGLAVFTVLSVVLVAMVRGTPGAPARPRAPVRRHAAYRPRGAAGRQRGRVRVPGLQRQAGPEPGPRGERDVPGLPPRLDPGPPAGRLRPAATTLTR